MANTTISGLSTAATTINGADLVEIEQGGSSKKASRVVLGYSPSRTVTGNTSFGASDETINVNTGTATITLPSATGTGRRVTVRKISSSAGTVTIARAGGDTIEGKTSEILKAQWGTAIFEDVASGSWAVVELHESGTWSPVADTNIASSTELMGKYTRTKNIINLEGILAITATSGTSKIVISGLPYTIPNTGSASTGNQFVGVCFGNDYDCGVLTLQSTTKLSILQDKIWAGAGTASATVLRISIVYML